MIKKFFFLIVLLHASAAVYAQEENKVNSSMRAYQEFQGWSADAMAGLFFPLDVPLFYYSVGGYPRYNFIAPKDYFSISVGAPLNFGFSMLGNSSGTFIQVLADVPATVDLNIGSRATTFNESLIGAYLGAGLNYNYMYYGIGEIKENLHTFGPVIHAGLRWEINGRETGFRISYLSGFNTQREQEVNGIIQEGEPANRIFSISVIYGIK